MNKILYIILISFVVSNCSLKPVVKHHGVPFLEKKQALLIVNKTNKNDIKKVMGSPSTKSKFNNDVWIYIERKLGNSNFKKFGKLEVIKNDVLVLEIDNYGLLKSKKFYNKSDMENLKIEKSITESDLERNSFIYNFLSSMRQKMNDPLGQRAKQRKKIRKR